MRRGRTLGALAVLVVVAVSAAVMWSRTAGEGEAAAGLTYRDTFYRLSSVEVRPEALGEILSRRVRFQDTTVDVRRIRGVDVATAVAAYTRTFAGTGSSKGHAWLLLSPDPDVAADPASHAVVRDVVVPPPAR